MLNSYKQLWQRILREPAVVVGVVVAAVTSATDQSWKGYAVAVGVALLRFVVSPAYGEKTPETQMPPAPGSSVDA